MDRELIVKRGHILVLDQLGTSAMTTNDIDALTFASKWLSATRKLLKKRKSDIFFCWASDTWVLQHSSPTPLYEVVDYAFPRLFAQGIYLRGALVVGAFYDLSNWPDLDDLRNQENVHLCPILGAGFTRAAQIESKAIKGMRVLVDTSQTHVPPKGYPISTEESEKVNKELSKLYDGSGFQRWLPYLVDHPWWRKDYRHILDITDEYLTKVTDTSEREHLKALKGAIQRWAKARGYSA